MSLTLWTVSSLHFFGNSGYTYDQVGNRLTKTNETPPTDNETTNYTYDDENRLTKVTITKNSKQKELTFTYDPFGRRITKTLTKDEIGTDCTAPNTCPRTTTYVYDNQNIIAEYDTNGEVQTRYTHGPNIDEPLAIEIKAATTFTPYFYHADGLGSITSISSASGTIVQRYAYDSFGNMTITTNGSISQPYTYTSREYDQETGMYFYRARYYDPKVGRFVTKDPIGFAGGINQFAYVENDPVNFTDPDGLNPYKDYSKKGGPSDVNNKTINDAKERLAKGGENARENARKIIQDEIDRLTKLLKDACGKARTKLLNEIASLRAFLKTGFRFYPMIIIIDPNTGMPIGMPGDSPGMI